MDDTLHHDLCEGVAALSAQVVEEATLYTTKEWQRRASVEVLSNCELFLECRDDTALALSDLHVLLQRQAEVVKSIVDEDDVGGKMLVLMSDLTKTISDQEAAISKLKEERTGAEEAANEISLDLHNQYEEIVKLKRRYDAAEKQLAEVQSTVRGLRKELRLRQKQIGTKDAAIRELKHRLTKFEKQQEEAERKEDAVPKEATIVQTRSREDRERRFAEIRSMLNRSKEGTRSSSSSADQPPVRTVKNWRLQALRETRDSRLEAIRGLLQAEKSKSSSSSSSITKGRGSNNVRDGNVSTATTEDTITVTDASSLGSMGW